MCSFNYPKFKIPNILAPPPPPLQVSITKESCTIVGDGNFSKEVEARVRQIRNLVANTEQEYEKEKLSERIARLSGGVAIIQVRHPTRGAQQRQELNSVLI